MSSQLPRKRHLLELRRGGLPPSRPWSGHSVNLLCGTQAHRFTSQGPLIFLAYAHRPAGDPDDGSLYGYCRWTNLRRRHSFTSRPSARRWTSALSCTHSRRPSRSDATNLFTQDWRITGAADASTPTATFYAENVATPPFCPHRGRTNVGGTLPANLTLLWTPLGTPAPRPRLVLGYVCRRPPYYLFRSWTSFVSVCLEECSHRGQQQLALVATILVRLLISRWRERNFRGR